MNNIEGDFFFQMGIKQILWIATKLVLYIEIKLKTEILQHYIILQILM